MAKVKLSVATIAIFGIIFLGGCSSGTSGSPLPPESDTSTPPAEQDKVFTGINACDLLQPITSQRGFDRAEENNIGGVVSGCKASKPAGGTAGVALRDDLSIADLTHERGIISDLDIAGREARQREEQGYCVVAIKVAENARADVSMTISLGDDDPCTEVKPLAEEIAKALPGG